MPHDKNGAPLKAGDKVTLECEIVDVQEGEYCTTTLKTVEVMPGNGQHTTISAVNAKMVVKVPEPCGKAVPPLDSESGPIAAHMTT